MLPDNTSPSLTKVSTTATQAASPDTHADTHCCYCAMQCQMRLTETLEGVTVQGLDHPINKTKLCVLGQNSVSLFDHKERLTQPLVRKNGRLVPVSWHEAMKKVVDGFKSIQKRSGNSANAVYSGASVSTEKAYLLGKFARVALKTPHIDYNGRYCMSSAAKAAIMAFGLDRGMNMPLEDIPKHDLIVLVGSNPAATLPIIMNYLLDAKKQGTQFIVIDPRKTITANLATLHLPVKLGGDLALANLLLKHIIAGGHQNADYIAERTNNFDNVKSYLKSLTAYSLSRETGLDDTDVAQAVQLLTSARHPLILTGRGNDQNSRGVDSTLAFINLALAIGANYGTLTGQANGQGGREHGMKADQLPGYRLISDTAARQQVSELWGIAETELPQAGYSAYELLQAVGQKEIHGLFVLGSNPVVSSPDKDNVKAWLKDMRHLVVVDNFMSETASLADVVLPGSIWAEETGTTTNLEGRVVLREALKPPPQGAKTDLEIIIEIAQQLGSTAFEYDLSQPELLPEYINDEFRLATKGAPADYFGISYARLRQGEELFWPCPDESTTGVKRIFEKGFAHPDGKAKFQVIPFTTLAETQSIEFPLQLTTGRYLQHYLTGNHTRRSPMLSKKMPEPYVEIHPDTALKLKLTDGELARLKTRRAESLFKVKLSSKIRPDVIFIPMHWEGEQGANRFTSTALDPQSKMPEFKAAAASLTAVPSMDDLIEDDGMNTLTNANRASSMVFSSSVIPTGIPTVIPQDIPQANTGSNLSLFSFDP